MPKVMISLPAELLAELDREAARRGGSRSALLAAELAISPTTAAATLGRPA